VTLGASSVIEVGLLIEWLGGGGTKPGVSSSPAKALTERTDTNRAASKNFLTSFIDLLLRFVVKAGEGGATKLDFGWL